MIPGLNAIGPALEVLGKLIDVFDYVYKTRHARKFTKLRRDIIEEEQKPIYPIPDYAERDRDLRDQGKIDKAYLEIKILLERINNEKSFQKDNFNSSDFS